MAKFVVFLLLCAVAVLAHKHESPFAQVRSENTRTELSATAGISATPDHLSSNGEWVTITWSGVSSPGENDWIGAFSQYPANYSNAPAKYKMCTVDSSYLTTGSGKTTFRLVNMRSSYTFAVLRDLTNPVVLAVSNSVSFANPNEPLQPRLSVTDISGVMRLMWSSGEAVVPYVRWGTTSGVYTELANATASTYQKDKLCGAPATTIGWQDPGFILTGYMQKLQPAQRYYYVFGDVSGQSAELSFTAPPDAESDAPVSIVAFGDMGKGEIDGALEHWEEVPALNTTRLITEGIETTDLLLHIGDISYAVGYAAQWDEFLDQITPIASRVPYMTCIGNHERDYPGSDALFPGTDSGGECGVPYEARFPKPAGVADQPWYSFEYGPVHVLLFSTEHDFATGTAQNRFIAADLAAVNRTRTPWVIVGGHRPMYIDSMNWDLPDGDQPVAALLRRSLEGLFVQHGVDLAIWGHHHSYQRTCPVKGEHCVPSNADGTNNAPVHVVIGMGGMGLSQNIYPIQPSYFTYVNCKEYGFTRMTVTRTKLEMTYYSDVDGGMRDNFVLTK